MDTTLVDVLLNWFYFLILVRDLLVILIDCSIVILNKVPLRHLPLRRCWAQNVETGHQGEWRKTRQFNKSNPFGYMTSGSKIQESTAWPLVLKKLGNTLIHFRYITFSSAVLETFWKCTVNYLNLKHNKYWYLHEDT